MRKLRIGYSPLSDDLSAPGDRRRIVYWVQQRGHELISDLSQKVDFIVASENSDFNSSYFINRDVPLIFDLIDAYLSPRNILEDLARGAGRKYSGSISGKTRPFSHQVREFCRLADAVICSSEEQKNKILPYNKNVHTILDFHEEIPFMLVKSKNHFNRKYLRILWEGQPATLGGLKSMQNTFEKLNLFLDINYDFVTDQNYFNFLNRFFKGNTLSRIHKYSGIPRDKLNLVAWSTKSLVEYAAKATLSIIPTDLSVPMIALKPENRLLIMWRLGLPCLTSRSPAYARVERVAGVKSTCRTSEEWLDSIRHLLESPSDAYEQVSRGQDYLRSFHSLDVNLQKWDRVFESFLS